MGINVALTPREFGKRTKYCIIAKCPTEEGYSYPGSCSPSIGSYGGLQEPVFYEMRAQLYRDDICF
jgi:hypothetical protein